MAPADERRVAGAARGLPALTRGLRLVPALDSEGAVRGFDADSGPPTAAALGRRPEPLLAIVDTHSGKCIGVHGPRGYDGAKKLVGRKRAALVDAEGYVLALAVLPANVQDRCTLPALDNGKQTWPSLRLASLTAPSRPSTARSGAASTACATTSSGRRRSRRASSYRCALGRRADLWMARSLGRPKPRARRLPRRRNRSPCLRSQPQRRHCRGRRAMRLAPLNSY